MQAGPRLWLPSCTPQALQPGCQRAAAPALVPVSVSAHVSIRQHTSAYVSIRQHTPAYVSIRQHTSAYVSVSARSSASVSACLVEPQYSRSRALIEPYKSLNTANIVLIEP
jgi:hypothetical protein